MQNTRSALRLSGLVLGCVGSLVGCEGDLSTQLQQQDPQVMAGTSGRISNTLEAGGSVVSRVNASDATAWVYVQMQTGKEVTPQDPLHSTDWDIALQRFQIKVNGGVSGQGSVAVALLTGTPFASLSIAPKDGYVTDLPDSADDGTEPDYAFTQGGTWYDYNMTTHVLSAKDQVYVVRSSAGAYYKLQFTGYYDQAGSSGYPTFRWQSVAAP